MKPFIVLLFLSTLFFGVLFAETGDQNPTNAAPSPSDNMNVVPTGNIAISPTAAPFLKNPIRIVHPFENMRLPALSSTFIYGSVPAAGKLLINGTPVSVHPGGGFLAMVNLSPGKNEIKVELILSDAMYSLTRTVSVAEPERPAPDSPSTIEYVTPRQDQELLPGDYVDIVCKGSPGLKSYFTVKGVRKKFPMIESETGLGGIYHGVYQVGDKDRLKNSRITVTLVDNQNKKIAKEADGILSLFPKDRPVMVEVTSSDVVLRAGPALSSDEKSGICYVSTYRNIIAGNRKKRRRIPGPSYEV